MPKAKKETASKVYLQKAVLEGYRTIRKLEAEFLPGLNIIIGKNGTGKTNLMEYLDRALSFGNQQQQLNASITLAKAFSPKAPPLRMIRESHYEAEPNTIFRSSPLAYSSQIKMSIGKERFKNVDGLIASQEFLSANDYNYEAQLIRHGIPKPFYLFNEPLEYSGSRESISKLFTTDTPLILRTVLGQLWIMPDEEGKEAIVENKLKSVSVIISIVKEPLKRFSVIEDIRLTTNHNIYFDATVKSYIIKNLFVEYKVNDHWLPFSSLSDGTKRIFYITAEVLAMEGYSSFLNLILKKASPTKKTLTDEIILLEEPELGLHPHQLAQLMEFLREQAKHKQIIISTHSPIVLDSVDPAELDRIQIAELTPEGTQLRRLTPEQQRKARIFADKEGLLSDYWRFSDLEV